MSTTIDQRVVEMQFDNKNFERNVSTTMSTLEKLKQSLNLSGASKGMENVSAAAKGINLSPLSNAAETVGLKFNAMYTMADQALRNITNSAVNTGKRIVSALTIDPIKTGLSEYETQINAVQTILANTESKGSTLDDVNKALDDLNTYADKTIYNFTEMTRNIGTFTAAGVDLDTSVNAIQGIANLAAVSGSNSQQASTAMYQLSQALSSGTVKLMDWNSVVNAGMGGQVFQDALKETARVHGIAIDQMIEENGSFRETLQEGWLTADILTETLSHFTMAAEEGSDQWNEYKKSLMDSGYTEEQALAILKLSNTATDAATKVKTFTQLWDTLKETAQSGWTQTWEILLGDFEEAKALFSELYETFAPMIEASSAARNELLKGWKDAGGRDHLIDSIRNIVTGLQTIVTPIKEAFREIFPPTTVEQLLGFTEGIKNLTEKLTLSDEASDKLKRTFKGLFAVVDIVGKIFGALFDLISPLFGGLFDLSGGILDTTASFGDWLVNLNDTIDKTNVFGNAVDWVHEKIKAIGDFLTPVIENLKEFGSTVSGSFTSAMGTIEGRFEPLKVLGTAIQSIFSGLATLIQRIAPGLATIGSAVGEFFGTLMSNIVSSIQNADYNQVFDIANGGIMAAIGIFIARFFKSGGDLLNNAGGFFDDFVKNINNILGGVGDALGAFTDSLKADTLKKIATAIGILAVSLLVLSLIPSEKLTTALLAITTLFGELMGAMALFSKISRPKGIVKLAVALISLSSAILILSIALKIMSTMSWEEMGIGLIALTVSLGALVGAVNLLPDTKINSAAKAIKKMSSAILVLAVALKIMGSMSWKEMGVGLIAMVVGLGALVGAVNLLPKDTGVRAAGMVGLAVAMVILGAALKIMATMSWDDVARSLVALAGSLGILAGGMALMKKAIPGATAMMIVAPALVILAAALRLMSGMSWEEIAKGLVTLGGSLFIIAGAMALMKKAIPGAIALLIVSGALAVFTPMLMLLGSMSMESIGKSLLMLAGVFAVVGIAGLLLTPLVPAIIGLSASLLLLGAACLAIGVGVLALGTGLTLVATAGSAAITVIIAVVAQLIALIPYFAEQVGIGIIRLCEAVSGGGAALCEAATVIIAALVAALVESVPTIVDGVLVLVDELLASLVEYTPTIVSALFDLLIGIINSIAEKLPDLIQAGVNLVMSLFSGIVEALQGIDSSTLIEGILAIGMMTALMAALAAVAALTPAAMLGVLGLGAVIAELALVLAAIGELSHIPGLQELISDGGDLMQSVGTAIGQFLGGIVGGFGQGISSSLPQIGTDLSEFMSNAQGFIEGAKSIDAGTMDGVQSIVGVIAALTAVDILEGLTSWLTGGSSLVSFGEELAAFGPNMKAYADSVAGIDAAAITASATAAQALAEMTSHIPNEGGMVAWFTGENSISKFGSDLVALGMGLSAYSNSIVGFNPEAVIASANAATALADMTSHIPNEGGMVAWFTGENSISKFGNDLVALGMGLSAYSLAITGFNAEAVIASADAATALVNMTSQIPNEGGMVAWFTGENSISKFGTDLVALGTGLSAYSNSILGFNAEAVIASANAATALVNMTSQIPNEGGMVAWFTGENSISKFGNDLIALGTGLLGFSTAVTGVNIESVTAAANAAQLLAQMTSYIPNEGGMVAWFTGENSLAKFAGDLPALGAGLKGFSDSVEGMNAENVTAAANAAQAIAQMASFIPNEGGVVAWFTGDNSVAKFAEHLPALGSGIKGFSDSVEGIVPENVTAAATAATSLAQMTESTPGDSSKLVSFGDNLVLLGEDLKTYFNSANEITSEARTASSLAITSITYASDKIDPTKIENAANAIVEMTDALDSIADIDSTMADGFKSAITTLGETNVESLIQAFENAGTDMNTAGGNLVTKFVEGVESKNTESQGAGEGVITEFIEGIEAQTSSAETACRTMASSCADAIEGKYTTFYSAGKYLVDGFAAGITAQTWKAKAKARAMADAAATAAEEELGIQSPSKVGYRIGGFFGMGFANAIGDYGRKVYTTSADMASNAREGLSNAIGRITDIINSDIDTQPTIRPVIDLSDVRSGVNAMGNMLNMNSSVGVMANVGSISSMMSRRSQNGANDDVVSAINGLRDKLNDVGNTSYNINGITYDDGSNISSAIETLVRAARIERRV